MRLVYTCVFAFAICFSSSVKAQDIYLKITGKNGVPINGESSATLYKDYVNVYSYAESGAAACTTGSAGSCKTNTGNFFFTIAMDKALNPMRTSFYKGELLDKVEVVFAKTGASGFVYYKLRLDDVRIISISDAVSSGAGNNTIQIEFGPTKFGWTYIPQNTNGSAGTPVKFGWDNAANQEWTGF